jgi:hypothetical protein
MVALVRESPDLCEIEASYASGLGQPPAGDLNELLAGVSLKHSVAAMTHSRIES